MWTFGRKIALGFAVALGLLVLIGVVSYRSIDTLSRTSGWVAHTHQVLELTAKLLSLTTDAETGARGYLLSGDEAFLEPYREASGALPRLVTDLRALTADNPAQQRRLDQMEPVMKEKLATLQRYVDTRRGASLEAALKLFQSGEGRKLMDTLRGIGDEFEREERSLLTRRALEAEAAASSGRATIVLGTLICALLVTAAALLITRSLESQIGQAVQHIQSSSAELQAAATQQATGAKEQATAMTEISTTIRELLTTSRQIAESAQRVAEVAADTAGSARTGDQTVQKSQDSVGGIRRQVDLIVAHMLELGKKSQQIGGVLEIINELAEQTNILAINATIEAAGAGDAGRRFAVVADEIRKLADRVGGSTKEIRVLVDDVRSAVNTTVMATESGSKAVDAGTRQFGEVALALRQITGLVGMTTEAAKEIELSTKQQATAVEQVTVAMANVSQAARETEASSSQTLQTSSQLAGLARDLARVVRPQASV